MKLFFLGLAFLLPVVARAAGVQMIELRGSINPGSSAYILESLAAARDADLFVIKLDTPGGLIASTRTIIQGISESNVPVAVWVAPSGAAATSAGALIALSAHIVAMQEGSNIGAAHPVGGSGEDIKGAMGEKITNDTAAMARAQAALRGRNVEAAEQIVTKSQSFSAAEAVKNHIADFIAGDLDALLRQIDGKAYKVGNPQHSVTVHLSKDVPLLTHSMTPKQRFLHFISDPNVSTVLLSLGGLCIWAEVSSGFSSIAAGVVGVLCFVLGFMSLQTLPVNTGGAILLCMGFLLLVLEAFLTSYGLLTAGALVSIFLGGLFLIDPGSGSMHVSLSLLIPLVAALGMVVGFVGYLLTREVTTGASGMVGANAVVSSVETGGITGTAYVNGELWNFTSDASVSPGDSLLVSSVQGLKIHLKGRT